MEITIMTNGSFRLKGRDLYAEGYRRRRFNDVKTAARITGMSRPTLSNWINNPETVSRLDLNGLTNLLVDGLGITPEEALQMKLGDIFQFIPHGIENKELASE